MALAGSTMRVRARVRAYSGSNEGVGVECRRKRPQINWPQGSFDCGVRRELKGAEWCRGGCGRGRQAPRGGAAQDSAALEGQGTRRKGAIWGRAKEGEGAAEEEAWWKRRERWLNQGTDTMGRAMRLAKADVLPAPPTVQPLWHASKSNLQYVCTLLRSRPEARRQAHAALL